MPESKALVDPKSINIKPDLIIVGKDCEHRVHRIAFLCLSPYFQKVFAHNTSVDIDGYYRLSFPDISASVLQQIVNYASYGKVDINEDNAIDLLATADRYNINGLINVCKQYLIHNINDENCFETYICSHYYNCVELNNCVTNYILDNKLIANQTQQHLTIDLVLDIWKKQNQFNDQ